MMSCNRHHPHSFAGPLPTIVGFKTPYQQVREEEGMALICMVRKRNLDRNDTVTVVSLQQRIRDEVAIGVYIMGKILLHGLTSIFNWSSMHINTAYVLWEIP